MHRFTQLYAKLDQTTRTNEKLAAMVEYFHEVPAADAAWALFFLSGQKIKRSVNSAQLRLAVAAETSLPMWLIDESYSHVGDVAETLAWLLPMSDAACSLPLAEFVESHVIRLRYLDDAARRNLLRTTWPRLSSTERLVWHKLITGEFRVGVSNTLVTRAMAEVAGTSQAIMAHRLSGTWEPTPEFFAQILAGDEVSQQSSQPYPFFLAHALEEDPSTLGSLDNWQLEWKWDGIRAQMIRRGDELLVWSRGEELITDRFPELHSLHSVLPVRTVLDGEILAWRAEAPLPFAVLQKRIGRLKASAKVQTQAPIIFLAFDLLEYAGGDVRHEPMRLRRERLEALLPTIPDRYAIRVSPLVSASSWSDVAELRKNSRLQGAEGLMLKQRDSAYGVGRQRGPWWKWKSQPFSIDAVLINAQSGHGRRAGLFTDYTFGLWHQGQLVPVAKAYSGLNDAEIREVDQFVREHTTEKFGPVRAVEPHLVFELHFENIQRSTRHRSGIAVRFPRIYRWRHDKRPEDADTLETLQAMVVEPPPTPPTERLLFDIH